MTVCRHTDVCLVYTVFGELSLVTTEFLLRMPWTREGHVNKEKNIVAGGLKERGFNNSIQNT